MSLLEGLAWEVTVFRHLPDEAVARKPVSWLFAEYERVAEFRWRRTTERIAATQVGTSRALAQAFGGSDSKLPDMPSYEEILEQRKGPHGIQLPAWHKAFERANADRRAKST